MLTADAQSSYLLLDPWRVKPFANQPRKRFRGIDKLADSIAAVGQVTPIVVTRCRDNGFDAELIDGERRLRACRQLGIEVRAVFQTPGVRGRLAASVAANFCRQPHDPMEIAAACERFVKDDRTRKEIAAIFGKTESWVSQQLSLLKLSPLVQSLLEHSADDETHSKKRRPGRMTTGLAVLLVRLPHDQQDKAARRIVEGKLGFLAARAEILRSIGRAGAKLPRRAAERRKQTGDLAPFAASLAGFRQHAARIAGLPQDALDADAKQLTGQQRRRLVADARELAAVLVGLSDALEEKREESHDAA